jgi:hypothetical protein
VNGIQVKKLRFFIALRIAILQKSTVLIVGGMKMVRLCR